MSAIQSLVILSVSIVACPAQTDPPVLSEMVGRWPHIGSFTLTGELNASYVIETSTNLTDWKVMSTNRYPPAKRLVLFETNPWKPRQFFRAWRLREPILRHALACFQSIDLNHPGTEVDSFDSANPAYSTDGRYDPIKRKDGGNVAVDSTLFHSLDIGNAIIRGKVSPADALDLDANCSVGSLAWVEAGNVGIEPGWISNDHEVHRYVAVPPFTNAPVPPPGIVGGSNYAYVLESGNYLLPSYDPAPDGRMRVVGHAALVIQGA